MALDWTKCYDHVSRMLLEQLANHCRLHAGLYKPMLAAYGMQQHILLNGILGPAAVPARGLAAWCPRATDWLAIMSHVLVRELQQCIPTTVAKPYVDDLTADIEHADDDDGREVAVLVVTAAETTIQRYAIAWTLKANMLESRRFSTSVPVRAGSPCCPDSQSLTPSRTWGSSKPPPTTLPPSRWWPGMTRPFAG
jgi:hypothetical protein